MPQDKLTRSDLDIAYSYFSECVGSLIERTFGDTLSETAKDRIQDAVERAFDEAITVHEIDWSKP